MKDEMPASDYIFRRQQQQQPARPMAEYEII